MLNKQKIAKAVNAVSVCVLAFFGLVLLYFGTRVFVCDKYPVSTTSMTPTIIPGDQILVNKLVFGARIYKNLKFLQGDSLVPDSRIQENQAQRRRRFQFPVRERRLAKDRVSDQPGLCQTLSRSAGRYALCRERLLP